MQQTVLGFTTHSVQHHRLNKLQTYSLPSSSYVNLTFGASGSTYTAPADGWFYAVGNSSAAYHDLVLRVNGTTGLNCTYEALGSISSPNAGLAVYCPVKRGDVVQLAYYTSLTGTLIRFIYAQGSEPQT